MRNLILPVLFLVALSMGCNNNPDQFGGKASITATIDGTAFSAEVSNTAFLDGTLNMGNIAEDDAQLQFNKVEEGTFSLNTSQGMIDVIFLMDENGNTVSVSDGSYTITNISNSKAEGSFKGTGFALTDFTLSNPITVDQGTFSASF